MRPFVYESATTLAAALQSVARGQGPTGLQSEAQFLAGGTTLVDLMKLDVMRPATVIDINALVSTELGRIRAAEDGLRLGALVRMAEAAEHPRVSRDFPAIAQSLQLAASQQLRNMASLGNARVAPTFAMCPIRTATSAIRARAVRRSRDSTAATQCSASATTASPPIRGISPRR
jgi:CO/xanthine dehydrogenase FAD-binding subunit